MKCKICDKNSSLVVDNVEGYIKDSFFDLYECNNCNLSFSNPMYINNFVYESIYKNSKNVPGYDRYYKYSKIVKNEYDPLDFIANQEHMYFAVKYFIEKYANKNSKILEIGSGLGYVTYALNKSGYNCIGIDISKEAIENAKNNYGDYFLVEDIYNNNPLLLGKFDLIFLTEVIEHVEDPVSFIHNTKKYLKDDGKILITTPNRNFESNNVFWVSDLPPVHFWCFSEKSLEELAKKLNLKFSFLNFTEFNKKNFVTIKKDFDREKQIAFFKNHNMSILLSNGNLINNKKSFTSSIRELIKSFLPRMFIQKLSAFRDGKFKYEGEKSRTLACILNK